jgi:virulence-associated protein VapD
MYSHDFNGILGTLYLAKKTALAVAQILDVGLLAHGIEPYDIQRTHVHADIASDT